MEGWQLPPPPSIHTIIPPMTPNNFREKTHFSRRVDDDTVGVRGAFKSHGRPAAGIIIIAPCSVRMSASAGLGEEHAGFTRERTLSGKSQTIRSACVGAFKAHEIITARA